MQTQWLTHWHTYTIISTLTQTLTHTLTNTWTHILTHTHSEFLDFSILSTTLGHLRMKHTHTHTDTHTLTHTHSLTHTETHTHRDTNKSHLRIKHTQRHTDIQIHTHTHTHTHTQAEKKTDCLHSWCWCSPGDRNSCRPLHRPGTARCSCTVHPHMGGGMAQCCARPDCPPVLLGGACWWPPEKHTPVGFCF